MALLMRRIFLLLSCAKSSKRSQLEHGEGAGWDSNLGIAIQHPGAITT